MEKNEVRQLEKIAWAPYNELEHPTTEDWRKSYNALKELAKNNPKEGAYPNTLGYLCYYGRHTGGKRQYKEARAWFERGAQQRMIESTYKLADMLTSGQGGPVDYDRALKLYIRMYLYCRDQFEGGMTGGKFADTALRMGKIHHEGKLVEKDDMEALSFLLEAKYAIEERERYGEYGDETVKANIERLIDECEKPDEETQHLPIYGLGLGRVPHYLLTDEKTMMTISIEMDEDGMVRLEFRRKRKDGKKPNRILWSVAPAMKTVMTDFVVLYGAEIRQIWTKNPGHPVECDKYAYDENTDTHIFSLKGEVQCRLQGGDYALPMDEFWLTMIRDNPETGAHGMMQ